MQQVANKQTVLLLRQTIKCIDRLLMNHGSRTAYLLYKMLQAEGGYEMYEMADYAVLATFHDLGAYWTEEMENLPKFETKSYISHSLYGYMIFKELSPFTEEAKIILYHHLNCDGYQKTEYPLKNIASYIYLADRTDIYNTALGKSFDIHSLRQYEGVRYTKEALDLLEKAADETDLLGNLREKSYQKELDELLDFLVISNEDEEKYIGMILFAMGLKEKRFGMEAAMCRKICDMIAQKMYLTREQRDQLKYASVIHDMGMLMMPQELIEKSGKLSPKETELVNTHVHMVNPQLKRILPEEIVEIAMAHHERGNGSGYPRGLKVEDMNLLQRILQAADVVTAMSSKRSYRDEKTEAEIAHILQQGVANGSFSGEVVRVFLRNQQEIMRLARADMEAVKKKQEKVEKEYHSIRGKYA